MHQHGDGVRKDIPKAVEHYKIGARLGNYFCFLGLARILVEEQHAENAVKAFSRFVEQESVGILR